MKKLLLNIAEEEYEKLMSFLANPLNRDTIELVTREANARYLPFVNADLGDFSEEVQKAVQAAEQAKNAIDSRKINQLLANTKLINGKLNDVLAEVGYIPNMAGQINQLCSGLKALNAVSWLNVGLSAVNIGISVAGFAIMAQKLDDISSQIAQIDQKIQNIQKDTSELKQIEYQKKTSSEKKKIFQYAKIILADFDEGKMIDQKNLVELITDTEVYLSDLIELTQIMDPEDIYTAIQLLVPLYTSLICIYYERFVNVYNDNYHPLHQDWMSIFDTLCKKEFVRDMEDFYFLKEQMHNRDIQILIKAHYLLSINNRMKIDDAFELAQFKNSAEYAELYQALGNYQILQSSQTLLDALMEEMPEEQALHVLQGTLREKFDIDVKIAA